MEHRIDSAEAQAKFGTHAEFISTLHDEGVDATFSGSTGSEWEIAVPDDKTEEFHVFLQSAPVRCKSCGV